MDEKLVAKGPQTSTQASATFSKPAANDPEGLTKDLRKIIRRVAAQEKKQEKAQTKIDDDSNKIERLIREMDLQKGLIVFGFVVLLIMVAQLVMEFWKFKNDSYDELRQELRETNNLIRGDRPTSDTKEPTSIKDSIRPPFRDD